MSFSPSTEDAENETSQTEAAIAALFDGSITLIASIRCYGYGSGREHRRCSHHLNLYPASPEETVSVTQAKDFARRHGWQRKQRNNHRVWICPDCL
ncbi:MAG TPA: hypothetical protein VFV38_26585 [Ktedonobacteraceae bacterium]|nr:hypothetical protein [Ktedonobacteraceae bacterium]